MVRYIRIILKQEYPIRFMISRILCALRLNSLFIIDRGFYKIRFFNTSISKNLWISKKSRIEDEVFLFDYLHDGDNVIDVGANIGNLTICASKLVGSSGKVFSFEANQYVFHCLKENLDLNHVKNTTIYNTAVGHESGFVSLSNEKNDGMKSVEVNGSSDIEMVKLDNMQFQEVESMSLLKVDVEGFEIRVFDGAVLLSEKIEGIYFEFNELYASRYAYTFGHIYDLLDSLGFDVFLPDVIGKKIQKIDREWNEKGTYNFLGYKKDEKITERLHQYSIV